MRLRIAFQTLETFAKREQLGRSWRVVACSWCASLAKSMAKRTAGKRKTARTVAANGRSVAPLSHVPTFGRPDLLILLGLAVVTFGIYAQVIGHQFINLDDPIYIQENALPTTRSRCVRR